MMKVKSARRSECASFRVLLVICMYPWPAVDLLARPRNDYDQLDDTMLLNSAQPGETSLGTIALSTME